MTNQEGVPLSELISVVEVAEALGVTRQYVYVIQRDDPRFPEPVKRFGRSLVWRRSAIEEFATQRYDGPYLDRRGRTRRPPARSPLEREWRQLSDLQRNVLRALASGRPAREVAERIDALTRSRFISIQRGLVRRGAIEATGRPWQLTAHGKELVDYQDGQEIE